MQKVIIAFDIDGTLRCNCEKDCRNANEDIAQLARILYNFKNTTLVAWSGGGKAYVESIVRDMGLDDVFKPSRCYGKIGTDFKPHIAIDDMHEVTLGDINLIVRQK